MLQAAELSFVVLSTGIIAADRNDFFLVQVECLQVAQSVYVAVKPSEVMWSNKNWQCCSSRSQKRERWQVHCMLWYHTQARARIAEGTHEYVGSQSLGPARA